MSRTMARVGGVVRTSTWMAFVAAVLCMGAAPLAGQAPDLIDFELEDQFGRSWEDDDFRGRATVVLVGDRGAAEYNEAWGRALHVRIDGTPLGPDVALVPVAQVNGVPFFLKGAVRGFFSEDRERWVLLDWDGEFADAYPLVGEHANLLVFGPDGSFLRHMVVREVDEDLLDDLVELLRDATGAPGPGVPSPHLHPMTPGRR